jgi:CobQ-like glutamine amidotransferase family enzyme
MTASSVGIALVFPELLGTYGDAGNAVVLRQRLLWRGIDASIVRVGIEDELPAACDVYVFGGGEDAPQTLATARLAEQGLTRAVDRGAAVLAVCAGLQLLGRSFTGADGSKQPGLGIVDCATSPKGHRQIGELVVEPTAFDLPLLTGFENHGGVTELGPGVQPLGRVVAGFGNGVNGVEGAVDGKVVGTYLHGPALARNPALADLMLSWIVGPMEPLDDDVVDKLRSQRLRATLGRRWRAHEH